MAVLNFVLAAVTAATLTGGPTTVNQLHDSGCVPVTWPTAGETTITYRGDGQAACQGVNATVTYDQTPGVADPVTVGEVFDLGSGSYQVDPDQFCGGHQIDVWLGDVTNLINTPSWNPAYRLITVRYPDAPCTPPTSTVVRVTPAPEPTIPEPTVPVTAPTVPAAPPTTVDTPTTTSSTPAIDLTSATVPQITDAAAVPELPYTGSGWTLRAIILGALLLVAGVSFVVVVTWKERQR